VKPLIPEGLFIASPPMPTGQLLARVLAHSFQGVGLPPKGGDPCEACRITARNNRPFH
jgi:hypothetical protein